MIENQFHLRSKEVQEVLSTPPKYYIFWGNVFILLSFLFYLFFLNGYRVPQKENIPIKIIQINNKANLSTNMAIIALRPLDSSVHIRKQLVLLFNKAHSKNSYKINGIINQIDLQTGIINVDIQNDNFLKVGKGRKEEEILAIGMLGGIEIKKGEVSILKLFKQRLTKSF